MFWARKAIVMFFKRVTRIPEWRLIKGVYHVIPFVVVYDKFLIIRHLYSWVNVEMAQMSGVIDYFSVLSSHEYLDSLTLLLCFVPSRLVSQLI